MTARHIYTVAGNGTEGFSGDGGPAVDAELSFPQGVTADAAGNLVIADTSNMRVRVLAARTGRFYGRAMTAGDIYTVAGDGTDAFSGDGGPATHAAIANPDAVAVDGSGNLVIADTTNDRVRVVAARTGRFYGRAMTAGDIYTVAGDGTSGYTGDGVPAAGSALWSPQGLTVDAHGNVVIADTANMRLRVVAAQTGTFYGRAMTAGDIYTVAGDGVDGYSGDGVPATDTPISSPQQVAVDGAGNLVFADSGNSRVRVVAARAGTFYGVAMTSGDIYTVAGDGAREFSGDGGPAIDAGVEFADGVAVDGAGNLIIGADNRLRMVTG
jgi:ribulose-5-phosphate 4-epimerase/fuculose-1-phosphate aldolase